MRYPYEKYIEFLFIKGYSDVTIANRVRALKLIPPKEKELEEKREIFISNLPQACQDLLAPENYNIKNFFAQLKKNKVTIGLEKLEDVYHGKRVPDWDDALLLMVDMDARIIVQTLSLFGYSDDDILKHLRERINIDVSNEALQLFYDMFWDIKNLSKLEVYHYIATCSIVKHRVLLTDAYHKKAHRVKWHMTGKNILTLEGVLEDVLNTSYEKYKSCSDGEDTAANDARTISWANMAVNAAEKLKNAVAAANETVIGEVQFELEQMKQEDIFKQEDIGNIV